MKPLPSSYPIVQTIPPRNRHERRAAASKARKAARGAR